MLQVLTWIKRSTSSIFLFVVYNILLTHYFYPICKNYITFILCNLYFYTFATDRVALLAGSAGVESSSGSAGGTPYNKPKGLWQITQKQKTVDDMVNICGTGYYKIKVIYC